ncbi:MAG: bifunctional DNA primase/polymerase [Planctomycetaceae bacterium]
MLDESLDIGNAALAYAAAKLAIFPCHYITDAGSCSCGKADCTSPGKHPMTPRGCLSATTDAEQIRRWWSDRPQANIGMATGATSGIWALDIESAGLADWQSLIAQQGETEPYGPVSITGGGGRHLFFRLNGESITNRAKLGGYPIDCRGAGGYVLLPPSNHASGNRYRWEHSLGDREAEDAPVWLTAFVTRGASPAASGGGFVCQADGFANAPASAKGSRHSDLVQLVGREFARGRQVADVLRDALKWASQCVPPHDDADVRRVVEDIAGREFAALQAGKLGLPAPSPTAEPFKLPFLNAEQFAATDYRMQFLVKRVLVAGQPCIMGGPKKSLKTSLLVDLAVSLGTGRPFLGTFDVPQRVNVGVLSGESGGFTLKETANRIALSKGVLLSGSSTHWCFDLPMLSRPDHLQALMDIIRERAFEVVIINPAYLCLLDDERAESAGNVFRMGNALRQFAQVGVETDSTLILCHHSTKAAGRLLEPLELEDLSQAGFAEFARQWLLVSRREPFEYGTGHHKLWLSIGGSAGHSGLYGVDVDEGVLKDDFTGRKWEVQVYPVGKLMMDKAAADAERKRTDAERQQQTYRQAIIEAMGMTPDGDTRTSIRDSAGINGKYFAKPFQSLIDDGTVIPCDITKTNGRSYKGFQLALGHTRTQHTDTGVRLPDHTHTDTPPLGVSVSVCASGGPSESADGKCPCPSGWEF